MFTFNCKGRVLIIDRPLVMGIINATPDSFYPGSRMKNTDDILYRVEKMISEGASIIDIGGQSTRPGSVFISAEEELSRVLPAVDAVHRSFPDMIISIDTFYSVVARECVNAGASIVNDISAGSMDPALFSEIKKLDVPYVLMHMNGTPQTMQKDPQYNDVTLEVFDNINYKISELKKAGIKDIIIDPGFGFGKTAEHNFKLLGELGLFKQLHRPILAGLSRKATIYRTLGVTANEALNGTTVMNTMALMNGATILRVHDVKEAVEAVKLYQAYKLQKSSKELLF